MFKKHRRTFVGILSFISIWFIVATVFKYFESENWENLNFQTALYWALVTMTTVGYGDFFPKSEIGRLFGFGLAGGVGVLALSTVMGTVTNIIAGRKEIKKRGGNRIIDDNHVMIVGFTHYSEVQRLIENLKSQKTSRIVIVDDNLEENPFLDSKVVFVKAEDSNWEKALLDGNIRRCAECYILANEKIHNTRAISLSVMIRNIAPATKIISQMVDPSELEMQLIKADGIMPVKTLEADLTYLTSEKPNSVIPLVSLITSSDNAEVVEYTVPMIIKENARIVDIIRKFGRKEAYKPFCRLQGKRPDFNVNNETRIQPGETLIFIKISS